MADADPVADLLRKAPLSDAQRATLWDAYQGAATPDDLAAALKPLQIPNPLKADLWDLKAGGRTPTIGSADPLERLPAGEQPRNLFGQPVALPADVAAQYAAMRDQVAGRAATPAGDVVVQQTQGLAGYGPAIGGTIGAIAGGPPGAAIGGAVGEAVNLAANPSHRAETPVGIGAQVAGQGALAGALEGAAGYLGPPLERAATAVYRGYLKPSLAEHLLPRAKEIVRTALEEALPLTEAGVTKAQALITDLRQQVDQMLARQGGTIDLHAIAERVRDFAKRKYFSPGQAAGNYDAALRVADSIDQHAALGLPPGATPTRVDVSLPAANTVKGNLYETAGEDAFGVATGQARKEAAKAGGYQLRTALEQRAPGIGPLNARESKLIDAATAITRAVAREANQNALVGVKTVLSAGLGGEEYGRTGDPLWGAMVGLAGRTALTPAVATRAAIVAYRLAKANALVPATAMRFALQAIQNEMSAGGAPAIAAAPGGSGTAP